MPNRRWGGRKWSAGSGAVAERPENKVAGVIIAAPLGEFFRYEIRPGAVPTIGPRLARRDGEWSPPQFVSAVAAAAFMCGQMAHAVAARIASRDAARFWAVAAGCTRDEYVAALRLLRAGIDLDVPAIVRVADDLGGWAAVCND